MLGRWTFFLLGPFGLFSGAKLAVSFRGPSILATKLLLFILGLLRPSSRRKHVKRATWPGVMENVRGCSPNATPHPRNKALLRDCEPLVSLKKALLGPYFLGGPLRFPWWCGIQLLIKSISHRSDFFLRFDGIDVNLTLLKINWKHPEVKRLSWQENDSSRKLNHHHVFCRNEFRTWIFPIIFAASHWKRNLLSKERPFSRHLEGSTIITFRDKGSKQCQRWTFHPFHQALKPKNKSTTRYPPWN